MDEILENPTVEETDPQSVEEGNDSGGQGIVVDAQTEGEDAAETVSDGEREEDKQSDDAGQTREQKQQSHEDNAAARAARLRAEAETEKRLRRQYDETISGIGIVNPYTGKPFSCFEDFVAYGKRYKQEQLEKRAAEQGRSVEELQEEEENRSYIARKRREEQEQKKAMEELKRKQDFMEQDLKAFLEHYPDVDVAKLEKNPKFRKFAGKRLYQEPLAELYADFLEIVSDTERAAAEKVKSRSQRGTGGGQGGESVSLNAEQAASLEEWNRDNPEMRMTAKEFLGR